MIDRLFKPRASNYFVTFFIDVLSAIYPAERRCRDAVRLTRCWRNLVILMRDIVWEVFEGIERNIASMQLLMSFGWI